MRMARRLGYPTNGKRSMARPLTGSLQAEGILS